MLIIFLNKVHFFNFCCIIHKDVGVKMYFAPSDTELLRALHFRNSKNMKGIKDLGMKQHRKVLSPDRGAGKREMKNAVRKRWKRKRKLQE